MRMVALFGNIGTFGPEFYMYKTLRNLIACAEAGEKLYTELADIMKSHYSPASLEIIQRFKCNSHFCIPGELVSTFVSDLHNLVKFCNIGGTLNVNVMMRDHLVSGIKEEHYQRHFQKII